jgi:aryl-alcohol dehydrogenase-like predicted oxidoreductase
VTVYIGTAQWGMVYGETNRAGIATSDTVRDMVRFIRKHGYAGLDTANGYGLAEKRIGSLAACIPVQTKVSGRDVDILATLARLRRTRVDGLLVHDWADLTDDEQSAAAHTLACLKGCGFTRRIGVSVYTAGDVRSTLARFPGVDVIQIPANALDLSVADSLWTERAHLEGVTIQARSIFLQGVLLGPSRFSEHPDVQRFHASTDDPMGACLSVIKAHPSIDEVVVGFATVAELQEFHQAWRADLRPFVPTPSADRDLTDPRRW